MKLRRLLCALLCCFMIITTLQGVPAVHAETSLNRVPVVTASAKKPYQVAEEYIFDAVMKGQTSVDLSFLNISREDAQDLQYSPYSSTVVQLTYYTTNNILSKVTIKTNYDTDELKDYFLDMRYRVETVLNGTASMNDVQKVVHIHDYLAAHARYDTDTTKSQNSHKSFGVLRLGVGVCQSYTYAFKYFMDYMGIENYTALSTAMNHIWNIVKVNGNYYHVDVTWDDPMNDRLGWAYHGFLLVSDAAIQKARGIADEGHHSWSAPVQCKSTTYDNYWWVNLTSPIANKGSYAYYITSASGDKMALTRRNMSNNAVTTLVTNSAKWSQSGAYSGMEVVGNRLIFNTATDIAYYDLSMNDGKIYRLGNAVSLSSGYYIYGVRITFDGSVEYSVKKVHNAKEGTNTTKNHGKYSYNPDYYYSADRTLRLNKGDTYTLKGVFVPSYANKSATFSPADSSVVSVSSTGVVTALNAGYTRIAIKTVNGKTDYIEVYVSAPVESIEITDESGNVFEAASFRKGNTKQLKIRYTPANYINGTPIQWTSSNPSVATVSSSGLVTGVNYGTTTITAKTPNGKTDSVKISIINSPRAAILGPQPAVVELGSTLKLKVELVPADADPLREMWTSKNKDIATVDSQGVVTPVSKGTATIQYFALSGIVETIDVTVVSKMSFTDVPKGKWYYGYVAMANDLGLLTGTSKTKFEPNANMTRGMIATVIHRIAGKPAATYKGTFKDVPKASYCSTAVEWAAKNKVVSGYSNGKFGPNDNITKQDVAVILHNYAKSLGIDVSKSADLTQFADYKNVSSYAKSAVSWAVSVGILSGSTDKKTGKVYLNPKNNATRGECSKMLLEAYKIYK